MKLIIAGSRNFHPKEEDYIFLEEVFETVPVTEVVSGGAKGADRFGELFAQSKKVPVKQFPADWKKYGKSAGPKRNKQMAEYADVLCVFWDGKSPGTKSMISLAVQNGLKIFKKITD